MSGFRVSVAPGFGVIARWDDAVLIATGVTEAIDLVLGDPRLGLDADVAGLSEAVRSAPREGVDGLVLVVFDGETANATMIGSGRLSVDGDHVEGTTLDGVRTHSVHRPREMWAGPVQGVPSGVFDLRLGVVPGSGVRIVLEGVEEAPPVFESISLGSATIALRPPLPVAAERAEVADAPLVMGVNCVRAHFNNPLARYCQVCGISMLQQTAAVVQGPRPTLGFLVFDDGSTYALDRGYRMGREPGEGGSDWAPIFLEDPQHTVSRVHAELRLEDWNIVLEDLGSTNGTKLWEPSTRTWTRLPANEPVALQPGVQVSIGRRIFVFEPAVRR
jgi:hypothetical protein